MTRRTYPSTAAELGDSDDDTLIRSTARQIAEKCESAEEGARHRGCWQALGDAGLTTLRDPDASGRPVADTSIALIVVEEMARSLCGAPILGGGMLAPELLRLAGVGPDGIFCLRGDVGIAVVLDRALHRVATNDDAALAWDTGSEARGILVAADELAAIELGDALPMADHSWVVRSVVGTASPLGVPAPGPDGIRRFETFGRLAVAADLIGAAGAIFDVAVQYAKDRVQFGAPIGSFQAVQHICAENLVKLEALRSSMLYAAWVLDNGDLGDAVEAALVAKAYASSAAVDIVHGAIQVLGGIAITWEHPAHRHLRRVLGDRLVLGDELHTQQMLAGRGQEGIDGLR